ncbi:MAG TPA: hypothetical protein VGP72_27850 [Planctomycetota bacterium]|jgi:hypothetical protein
MQHLRFRTLAGVTTAGDIARLRASRAEAEARSADGVALGLALLGASRDDASSYAVANAMRQEASIGAMRSAIRRPSVATVERTYEQNVRTTIATLNTSKLEGQPVLWREGHKRFRGLIDRISEENGVLNGMLLMSRQFVRERLTFAYPVRFEAKSGFWVVQPF